MELLKYHGIPWNSMELDKFDILKNHIFKYCCWYLIDDYMYLAKISQKRYIS